MGPPLKKNLITGLIILLPVVVTVALMSFLIDLFTHPFVNFVSSVLVKITPPSFLFLSSEQVIRYISKALILMSLFFITVLLGILTRWFIIKTLLSYADKILHKIPGINTIYKASQEMIKTLFNRDQTPFKQVVMVPFPHTGLYALALVSRDAPHFCKSPSQNPMVSVLLPTTPNPTSGFLLMYDKKDLIYLDINPEDAIKYIISGGVLVPNMEPSL